MADARPPQVSVVMSIYNGRVDFLAQAVESILDQEFHDFEFLIVDDGSDAAIAQALRRYTDPRIHHVRNATNLGLARSLNRGLKEARGIFVTRQDADDRSHPSRLGRQVEFLTCHPEVGLVGTAYAVIDDASREMAVVKVSACSNEELQERLKTRNGFMHGSVMLRRAWLEELGGYRALPTCQDYDLWLRMAERHPIANLPEPLYQWRLNRAGLSVQHAALQLWHAVLVQEFAKERRRSGADTFHRYYNDEGQFVGQRAPVPTNPWNIPMKESAVPYFVLAGRCLAYGDVWRAIRFGLRGLVEDPWNPSVWSLLIRRPLRRVIRRRLQDVATSSSVS